MWRQTPPSIACAPAALRALLAGHIPVVAGVMRKALVHSAPRTSTQEIYGSHRGFAVSKLLMPQTPVELIPAAP